MLLREGRPLLAHLLDLAPRFADTVLVTSTAAPFARFGVRVVADVVPDRGAPGGVHAALVHAQTPWVLVVAADMPFVSEAVVDLLLAHRREGVDAVGIELDGRLEPLLACYRSRLAPAWGAALDVSPSFRALWQTFSACLLTRAELERVDPGCRAVVSINTPEAARANAIALPQDGAPDPRSM